MNRNKSYFIIVLILFIFGEQSDPSFAQTWGKIVGVVKDGQTGELLPGANVMIEGSMIGAASDTKGYYMILRVPTGKHTIIANYLGYQRALTKNVEVLTGLTTTVNFDLHPEALLGEEVVIVAESPLVRKDLTSTEARIQADKIEKMPVQEVNDILDLQAGIIRDTEGGLHIRGGRSSEIAYMVNGINITDDYSREQALAVENESIQELQVISGTFNAEYGNAMSGIINVVTKTGGNTFNGMIEGWTGDYFSKNKNIFWNIDDINMMANYNLQCSFGGPILKDRLTFFMSGRRWVNNGWLYGPNLFNPQGRAQVINGNIVTIREDSSAVSMNSKDRWSGMFSLNWRILNTLTYKIDILGSEEDYRWYNHAYRLNPNGLRGARDQGYTFISKLTHILGKRTFHELIVAYKFNKNISRLYNDPFDSRYVHGDSLATGTLYRFIKAGTDLFHSVRSTTSVITKWELTSQINAKHQIKTGVEIQKDEIQFDNFTIVPKENESGQQIEPFQPAILPISSPKHDLFIRRPMKYAAYIQDKIEYERLIINIGLRFDYFDANWKVPVDPEDPNIYNPFKLQHIYKDNNGDGVISIAEQVPENEYTLEERETFWYKKTTPKHQLSPRLGIAYPITDEGVIHFSYGIFQQIPEYNQLYYGDQFKLTEGQGIQGPFGNPDLKPQRTTMYELGFKQQLSENIAIDITGFYRDIRDWISSSALITTYTAGVSYSKKINRDFANVRGITLAVNRRLANHFAINLDYTLQVAEGTNSAPEDEYFALQEGAEPKKQLMPMDWDQTHALNFTFFVGNDEWGASFTSKYHSGQPYTPDVVVGKLVGQTIVSGLKVNSRRMPDRFTVDLNLFKNVKVNSFNIKVFATIYNLFDMKNPLFVYQDTGKPDFTFRETQQTEADPGWFIRPDFYSEPRRIQVGAQLSLR